MLFPRNTGIHTRLLVTAILVITSSTITLGYSGLSMVKRLVSERFNQQIDYMTEQLAVNAELGILIEESSLLEGLAKSVLNEKDVVGVEITDNKGRLIAKQSRFYNGPFLIKEKKVILSQTDTDGFDLEIIAGSTDKRHIGFVRIKYTMQGIQELYKAMAQRFVLLSLGLALSSCIIFFLISHSLVRPVISLANVANLVSKGDNSIRALPGTIPETRRLAFAFNDMLDSIERNRKALIGAQARLSRQEALAEVGKFSMMIAHEVKNPLAIIKSSLSMLKKDLKIPEDNLLLNYTEEELTRLNTLIESFLMFSRPTKPNLISTDINQVVEQVVLGFELQYDSKFFKINSSIPDEKCITLADADLLSRALSNIIRNACDASNNKGKINITVKRLANFWTVSIRDYGKGIEQKDVEKLFEPFYTTKTTGTGLGLAFADQVLKAHGGVITAENHKISGAVFCIKIPLESLE
ncbi:Signal transduction histidine kinase [Desulfocicer vacuolatum DSM 3385]|uniref:histidine kinase n=1 Tax=Desulfocicer vacuolatum DSM 3385 TaxID=1121400 RepID=A0A1W2BVD7_9BACT|nr:HAMP domain-containing sensor histidine kinase [Desulfocicer vacuolatum]SMC76933.1 Signal transduction histidine kinase [Desulfocicer vacuolatum DSM 3385]